MSNQVCDYSLLKIRASGQISRLGLCHCIGLDDRQLKSEVAAETDRTLSPSTSIPGLGTLIKDLIVCPVFIDEDDCHALCRGQMEACRMLGPDLKWEAGSRHFGLRRHFVSLRHAVYNLTKLLEPTVSV